MVKKMAGKAKAKNYLIKVVNNPNYCGIDAGSVQFANGQAIIPDGTMVEWFREHEGYEVSPIDAEPTSEA